MFSRQSFLLLLIVAIPRLSASAEYNHDTAVGEWIQYSTSDSGEFGYYYLKIEPDFSGLFSYQLYQSEPVLVTFTRADLSFEHGFVVLDDGEFRRIVFSAYAGLLLTGVMWFYQENGEYEESFSSFFLRLSGVSAENIQPEVQSIRETVKRLSE